MNKNWKNNHSKNNLITESIKYYFYNKDNNISYVV